MKLQEPKQTTTGEKLKQLIRQYSEKLSTKTKGEMQTLKQTQFYSMDIIIGVLTK